MKKLAVFIFLLFATVLLLDLPVVRWLELKSIDWRFGWRGPRPVTGRVVVVALDEKSLSQEGRWPWPRQKMADLIRGVRESGARWIEMDVVFAEPSEGDEILAQELRRGNNGILGYFFYQNTKELEGASIGTEKMEEGFASILPTAFPEISGLRESLREMVGVVVNTPEIATAANSQGYFNAFPDPDGSLRRFPLMVSYRGKIFPSLSLETYSHHKGGFDPVPVRERSGEGLLEGMSIGADFVPTNKRGEMLINYRGGEDVFTVYSATDVLRGRLPPGELKDRTVLIGATAVGIYDLRVTPVAPIFPGVLVQANLLDNLYGGDFLIENDWTKLGSLGVLFLLTLIALLLFPRLGMMKGLLITTGAVVGYVFAVQWLFEKGYLFSLVTPSLEIISVSLSMTIYRGLTEEMEKRRVRKAFQSYLHPDIVEELIRNPEALKLGGQRQECTILFSDVRNFTSISEKMDPETLVRLMNDYFDPISQEIINAGGYIDKFIGDAVMAIFGAPKATPDHPLQACRAALAMKKKVEELAPLFREKFRIEEFKTGIGVHTGPVILGNIGTSARLNYTVMGDTVNLASRLEGATKSMGVTILISQTTYDRVSHQVDARTLHEIHVKGKEETIKVYELI